MRFYGQIFAALQIVKFIPALFKLLAGDEIVRIELLVALIVPFAGAQLVVQVYQLGLQIQAGAFHFQPGVAQIVYLLKQFRLPVHDIQMEVCVIHF